MTPVATIHAIIDIPTMKRLTYQLVFALCLIADPLFAQGEIVTPDVPKWSVDVQGTATVAVTTDNPRFGYGDVGFMSLALHTTGNMHDWAFVTRAMVDGESWGTLRTLTQLSFDWFRSSVPNWDATETADAIPLYDWMYKSPVLRILLEHGAELVWENYFNRDGDLLYIDTWQTSDVLGGRFWYRQGDLYSTVGDQCAVDALGVWTGLHQPVTIHEAAACFGNAQIVGISVGVGSQWPYAFTGYVDNVMIGFDGSSTVNANFDRRIEETSTVPEPSTIVMLAIGLLALLGGRRRPT